MAHRAVVDPAWVDALVPGEARVLPDDVAHRFARVLRLAEGAELELFDGRGRLVSARFLPPASVGDARVHEDADRLPPLVVAQAMTTADKLEQVAQRACELGASALLLFDAERGQVHLDGDRADKRRARLERIAADAARQSGRSRVPEVLGPIAFDALLARIAAFEGLSVAGVVGAEATLSDALRSEARARAGVLVVVGPEGGLSVREVDRLVAAGTVGVRLGAYVLRTETAALAALAAIQAHLGTL
jgi:16S rRNA (uracil1498-N3)-methyltransferase